jgi:hypothetical protein
LLTDLWRSRLALDRPLLDRLRRTRLSLRRGALPLRHGLLRSLLLGARLPLPLLDRSLFAAIAPALGQFAPRLEPLNRLALLLPPIPNVLAAFLPPFLNVLTALFDFPRLIAIPPSAELATPRLLTLTLHRFRHSAAPIFRSRIARFRTAMPRSERVAAAMAGARVGARVMDGARFRSRMHHRTGRPAAVKIAAVIL